MNAKPYFKNIQSTIAHQLEEADNSIYVSVAWFTDNILFDLLCQKAKADIKVAIVIYDDDINQRLHFPFLEKYAGRVYKVAKNLMHNKFCVIDEKTIITGSYNWTYSAANQDREENIIVIKDVPELATQYIHQFNQIIKKYFGEKYASNAVAFDAVKVAKRLQIIQQMIELEEYEDIDKHLSKIQIYALPVPVLEIVDKLIASDYEKGLSAIQQYQKRSLSIINHEDAKIKDLKLSIKILEIQIAAITSEVQESEKLIHDFGIQHHRYLGDIIRQILLLRKLKSEEAANKGQDQKEAAEEAKKEYEDFTKNYQVTEQKKFHQLNTDDQKLLKKLHRKAVFACHPDKVPSEMKAQAEAIFRQLQQAYEENDLEQVRKIATQLENGIVFNSAIGQLNSVEKLSILQEQLRDKKVDLLRKLTDLQQHETYVLISGITDWEGYFMGIKEKLEEELDFLMSESLEV